jgi:hypothetical protein
MSRNIDVLARLRRILIFLLICLSAVPLVGLYPEKAHAGAGGIDFNECAPANCLDPPNYCPISNPFTGSPNTFVAGPAMIANRAFFGSTPLQFEVPSSSIPPNCTGPVSVFRFGLVSGGIDANGNVLGSAEIFGPDGTDSSFSGLAFVQTGAMQTPRAEHQATLLSSAFSTFTSPEPGFSFTGQALITGGVGTFANGPHSTSALSTAELFSFTLSNALILPDTGFSQTTVTGQFAFTANPMNAARTLHQATLLQSGKVLITGGLNNKRQALNSAELYDPNGNMGAGTFTPTKGSMKHARFGHTATLLDDGTVLIAGGYSSGAGYPNLVGSSNSNQRAAITATAEIYNPNTDTFTEAGRMSVPRAGHTASRIADTSPQLGGSVLIAGGITNKGVTDTAELYTPGQGFARVGNMGTARFLHAAGSISTGQILIAGGSNGQGTALAGAERFVPGTSPRTSMFVSVAATMNSTRKGFSAGTRIPIEFSDMVILTGGVGSSGTSQNTTDIYFPPSQ